jgi:hypothetical protein
MGFAPPAAAYPQHTPGAQAGAQLASQRPLALHVQCLVDGLVADAYRFIVREVEPQAPSELLWAPKDRFGGFVPC